MELVTSLGCTTVNPSAANRGHGEPPMVTEREFVASRYCTVNRTTAFDAGVHPIVGYVETAVETTTAGLRSTYLNALDVCVRGVPFHERDVIATRIVVVLRSVSSVMLRSVQKAGVMLKCEDRATHEPGAPSATEYCTSSVTVPLVPFRIRAALPKFTPWMVSERVYGAADVGCEITALMTGSA